MSRIGYSLCIMLLAVTTCNASPSDTTPDLNNPKSGTPSQSIRSILGLISWLDDISLRDKIVASMKKLDGPIATLLAKAGQQGVAVEVDIEHNSMTAADGRLLSHDQLLGNDVKLIGAGTSLDDIWLATVAKDATRDSEANLDTGRSFFIWFSRKGADLVTNVTAERGVRSKAARRLGDDQISSLQQQAVAASGLANAIDFLEQNLKDHALSEKIKALRAAQAEDQKKIADVEGRLQENIDQEKRAQALANIFNTVADVLSFASQKDTIKAILGADVPIDKLDAAKTPADVVQIIQTIIISKQGDRLTITAEKQTLDSRNKDYSSQYMQVIRAPKADYPYQQVPQLQLPKLP